MSHKFPGKGSRN